MSECITTGGRSGRGMAPRGLLVLLMVLAVLGAAPAATWGADSVAVSETLEGCRKPSAEFVLPNTNGDYICPDGAYTSGNLGKFWAELDYVPHRVTMDAGNSAPASQTYTFTIAFDSQLQGHPGYDLISEPVLNEALSDDSCQLVDFSDQLTTTGVGGSDETIYRTVTLYQEKNTTCVIDYYGRLAIGAAQSSGSPLHANLGKEDIHEGGRKDVPLPVNDLKPQDLSKTMTATQGSDHAWDLEKNATPATVSLPNTCLEDGTSASGVQITVSWERLEASPSGDVTVITHVYATNPASRVIEVNVSDVIYSGTDALDTAASGFVAVSPNTTEEVLEHTLVVAAEDAVDLNDVATATYRDPVNPDATIPGTTTAEASATVQASEDPATNQTATITDEETIDSPFTFSVDSVSGSEGSFGLGTPPFTTAGPATWTSEEQSGAGSVTFNKTIYAPAGTDASGSLDDTATLNGADGFVATALDSIDIDADRLAVLTIDKSIPFTLGEGESVTFHFDLLDGNDVEVGQADVTIGEGESSGSATISDLPFGDYTLVEEDSTDFTEPGPTPVTINACAVTQEVTNDPAPATASVLKVTNPAGSEGGWTMTLSGPGIDDEVEVTGDDGTASFDTQITEEGTYTITETGMEGWQDVGGDSCTIEVDFPADLGQALSCTITNERLARAKVIKTVSGGAPTGDQAFNFQIRQGASPTELGELIASGTANAGNGGVVEFDAFLVPGETYQICEEVLAGWSSTIGPDPFAIDQDVTDPDNSWLCADFVATAPASLDDVIVFEIDNSPPPGGRALTIGYWKNHASCKASNGNQDPVLDETLAAMPGGGVLIGDLFVNTCAEAVALLNKSDLQGKKRASDPAYNLAAQLMAVELNLQAGAGTCADLEDARAAAQALLAGIDFTGTGSYLKKTGGATGAQANALAAELDAWNNDNAEYCSA